MSTPAIKSERALRARLKALGALSDEQRNSVVCSLIGHSRIQTTCFGYYYCARCDAQVGDTLSVYLAEKAVVVGHNCEQCRANYAECTWRDKVFTPDPFAAEASV